MPTDITNKQKISKDQLQLQNLKLTEEGIGNQSDDLHFYFCLTTYETRFS